MGVRSLGPVLLFGVASLFPTPAASQPVLYARWQAFGQPPLITAFDLGGNHLHWQQYAWWAGNLAVTGEGRHLLVTRSEWTSPTEPPLSALWILDLQTGALTTLELGRGDIGVLEVHPRRFEAYFGVTDHLVRLWRVASVTGALGRLVLDYRGDRAFVEELGDIARCPVCHPVGTMCAPAR